MNNPLSYSSLRLDLFSKHGTCLKPTSGFVIESVNHYYLVTNWHAVSGRDISAPVRQESVIKPYILKTAIHTYGGRGEKSDPPQMGFRRRITVQLYDDNDVPRWIERRSDKQYQPMVDVVALPIQLDLGGTISGPLLEKILGINTNVNSWPDFQTNYWVKTSAIPISA